MWPILSGAVIKASVHPIEENLTLKPKLPAKPPERTSSRPVRPARSKPHKPVVRVEGKPVPPEAAKRDDGRMRIAKAMARAGLCSRRDAERWIADGRVSVNGALLKTPAFEVGPKDRVVVDGRPMGRPEPSQLWRYYKPKGEVTTNNDPQGRPTVFDNLPADLPRVVSIGRLDFNTEGLLLLTNDGELARHLELPSTGWLRRYRVRARGRVSQADLDKIKDGVEIEGVRITARSRRRWTKYRALTRGSRSASARARTAKCARCCRTSGWK